jgi:hypothetical protein
VGFEVWVWGLFFVFSFFVCFLFWVLNSEFLGCRVQGIGFEVSWLEMRVQGACTWCSVQ